MKPSRPYSRHGLDALKARVKIRGLQVIDRRTAAARALLAWRKDLLQDLGGEDAVSAQQRVLVELERLGELRAGGASFRRVGRTLGVAPGTVRRLWQARIPPEHPLGGQAEIPGGDFPNTLELREGWVRSATSRAAASGAATSGASRGTDPALSGPPSAHRPGGPH